MTLLARRFGELPEATRAHVAHGVGRGNPLYLDHLAEAIKEGCAEDALPGTLHEAVLARLDGLVGRARTLTHWSNRSLSRGGQLEAVERALGDWLDRLETTDVADLETIGRYLARLRAADFELVVARSLLGMPVPANRRLAWAVERLAAASTDALLDYLETIASDGRPRPHTRLAPRRSVPSTHYGWRTPSAWSSSPLGTIAGPSWRASEAISRSRSAGRTTRSAPTAPPQPAVIGGLSWSGASRARSS